MSVEAALVRPYIRGLRFTKTRRRADVYCLFYCDDELYKDRVLCSRSHRILFSSTSEGASHLWERAPERLRRRGAPHSKVCDCLDPVRFIDAFQSQSWPRIGSRDIDTIYFLLDCLVSIGQPRSSDLVQELVQMSTALMEHGRMTPRITAKKYRDRNIEALLLATATVLSNSQFV